MVLGGDGRAASLGSGALTAPGCAPGKGPSTGTGSSARTTGRTAVTVPWRCRGLTAGPSYPAHRPRRWALVHTQAGSPPGSGNHLSTTVCCQEPRDQGRSCHQRKNGAEWTSLVTEGTGRAAHGKLDLLTLVVNSALGWNTSLNTPGGSDPFISFSQCMQLPWQPWHATSRHWTYINYHP